MTPRPARFPRRCSPVAIAVALACGFGFAGSAGCAQQKLMPTPIIIAQGGINPFTAVPPERTGKAPIFVASGRTRSGSDEPAGFYTDNRSRTVRLGMATVAIGPEMQWDELVHESTAAQRKRSPTVVFESYREFGELWTTIPPAQLRWQPGGESTPPDRVPAEQFVAEINRLLASSQRRQITIYVHGFNTTFDGNLGIAAQFWHYMGRDGVMMSFDWPSRGSVFAYQVDKANASFATRQFRLLLEFLAEHTSVERINILAHSAGAPVVLESLRDLSLINRNLGPEETRARCKLGRVVLAAPDMDLLVAANAGLDGAAQVPESLAIYASTRDAALRFSGNIFAADRLGASVNRLTPPERAMLRNSPLQAIDVTNAERRRGSLIGHSYYHENPWVSSDLALLLAVGTTPDERGLVRDPETAFWSFPNTYEDSITRIAKALLAKYGRAAREPE